MLGTGQTGMGFSRRKQEEAGGDREQAGSAEVTSRREVTVDANPVVDITPPPGHGPQSAFSNGCHERLVQFTEVVWTCVASRSSVCTPTWHITVRKPGITSMAVSGNGFHFTTSYHPGAFNWVMPCHGARTIHNPMWITCREHTKLAWESEEAVINVADWSTTCDHALHLRDSEAW